MNALKWFLISFLVLSLVRVDITYHKDQPEWLLWGNPNYIQWDDWSHEWVNRNLQREGWIRADMRASMADPKLRASILYGECVPVKKEIVVLLNHDLCSKPEHAEYVPILATAFFIQADKNKRRFVLINVEQNTDCDEVYRTWPHLGLLAIGTVAAEEEWQVAIWDEFVQGHADLRTLVQPGDVVGFSIVVSGMDRSIVLAEQAKQLGASAVIAGNDAAIFRSKQILALPETPIDAVFTSNSTNAVRAFFRAFPETALADLRIPEVATSTAPGVLHSNDTAVLRLERTQRRTLAGAGETDPLDGFVVPRLDLFGPAYWEQVWRAYRSQYGHKHAAPDGVRGATIHLAQGCTRTQGKEACSYCTIFGVGDIRVPSEEYLAALVARYDSFGINTYYNVTDSAYEMRQLVTRLRTVGFRPESLVIYGRAHGLAHQPDLLDAWLSLVDDRLLVNCGMDSGDERMLTDGVQKASTGGSRLAENHQAILNLRGSGAHLQFSLIFGSPGETTETCVRSLDFIHWITDTLGPQCDAVECDIFWLNFGSPASRVFTDYTYSQQLAALAQKTLTYEEWYRDFGQHADALSVPRSAQEAWYHRFTRIDLDTALAFVKEASAVMDQHPGRVKGRVYAFKRPRET
ncbi:hypothetical protein KBD18_00445 [Patescibacteria group bacterium]|nr:hypothetical protein [Patescibacteria group bacterium]